MNRPVRRRDLSALLMGAAARPLWAAPEGTDELLRTGIERYRIPGVVAMAATAEGVTFSGAHGKRDEAATGALPMDSIFNIASMTKAITCTAAMQLIEQGKLKLHEPAARRLPELAQLQVLHGYDGEGRPVLKRASRAVTLHDLMTHTAGFCYSLWDEKMLEFEKKWRAGNAGKPVPPTLMFEPGARWQYGTGIDWTGRLVEAASGQTLEAYFQEHILGPLGMTDTSYILPPEKFDRLVANHNRQADESCKEVPRKQPGVPKSFNGGGGLLCTAADYIRFMQMILRKGAGPKGERVLTAKSVEMMSRNQTGRIRAGILGAAQPALTNAVDFHPGFSDRYTYGFLLNPEAYPNGRSAGSLAWAGFYNTYYWIDPRKGMCAVILMQLLPFVDHGAVALLREFERSLYA